MKRIFALCLALFLLLTLAACGGREETTPTGESIETTADTTESINDPTDGTQGTTEVTTGEETDSVETTIPSTTEPPITEPLTTEPPETTSPTTTTNVTIIPETILTETTPPETTPPETTPSVTTPSVTTPSVTTPSETTPPAAEPSITPPDTSELEKQIFQLLYTHEEAEYLLSVFRQIPPLEQELSNLQQVASDNYVRYMQEKQQIKNRFEAMGLLNSGAYQGALKENEDNYKATSQRLTEQIDSLEEQIAILKAEEASPSVSNILAQLANNNNMTYQEAVDKYNKYMN